MLNQLQKALASRFAGHEQPQQPKQTIGRKDVNKPALSALKQFQLGLARTFALSALNMQSRETAMNSTPSLAEAGDSTKSKPKEESLMPTAIFMGAMLCVAAYASISPSLDRADRVTAAEKVSMADVSILSARSNRSISSETVTNLDNLGWQAYGAHMRVHQLIEQGASPDQLRLALESRRASYQQLDAEVERTRVMHGKSNGWVSPWGSLRDALHEAGEAFTEVAARVGEPHLGFMDGLPYSREDRLLTEGLPHYAAEDKAKFFATMMNARLNGRDYTLTLDDLKEMAQQRLHEESQEQFAARPGQS